MAAPGEATLAAVSRCFATAIQPPPGFKPTRHVAVLWHVANVKNPPLPTGQATTHWVFALIRSESKNHQWEDTSSCATEYIQ